ncbi:DUF1684 domain-containing protein [Xylella fastidiosa subsp. sandyi]|uniref:DUF1684 domain-containing protein n=1 Tax=Xylella fastidiosa TaxID=2371 RepID=UPI000FFE82D5|nr:DUF1684 domain-containing protein [Xylella fastidiosa]RWA45521.1 hypothetical protein XfCFBP8356_00535 [Xylella fastidiosa subsp. sandyi]
MRREYQYGAVLILLAVVSVLFTFFAWWQRDHDVAGTPFVSIRGIFQADHRAWCENRRRELTKPDGWMSLIGLHWLGPKAHYVGSSPDNGIRLAMGPPDMGMIERDGDVVWFTPHAGVPLTVDGHPLRGRVRVFSDADLAPTMIGFDGGKGWLTLIRRGDRLALRVRHADAPSRLHFTGLEYWPSDPEWRISARYLSNKVGATLSIFNIVGMTANVPNVGVIAFERLGRTYHLQAIRAAGKALFVMFADRTSGHGSYPAGRFLEVDPPDKQGRVVLDFNRAYNPPCAFTLFTTCLLPPSENRLNLAVTAGEKAYHVSRVSP